MKISMISVENVSYNYGEITALKNVSLNIEKGDFIGIIGPNGGGKTTLIKLILNIIKPAKGSVEREKNIVFGYVPQVASFERTFPISVVDVVLTGHLPKKIRLRHRFSDHEISHAFSVMEKLKIRDLADKKISDLSLGQLQKVLIARALMNHPNLLVLDEPTASIDSESSSEIYSMISNLSKGITILMITHDSSRDLNFFNKLIYVNKTIHIHTRDMESINSDGCPITWLREGDNISRSMHLDGNKEID